MVPAAVAAVTAVAADGGGAIATVAAASDAGVRVGAGKLRPWPLYQCLSVYTAFIE